MQLSLEALVRLLSVLKGNRGLKCRNSGPVSCKDRHNMQGIGINHELNKVSTQLCLDAQQNAHRSCVLLNTNVGMTAQSGWNCDQSQMLVLVS